MLAVFLRDAIRESLRTRPGAASLHKGIRTSLVRDSERSSEPNGEQMAIRLVGKRPQIRLAYSHTLSDECRDAVHPQRRKTAKEVV
jgi:hypothetical protein